MRKYSLKELEHLLPVLDENEQKAIMGGGSGSYYDPFTPMEYLNLVAENHWSGGYVDGLGLVDRYTNVSYNSSGWNSSADESSYLDKYEWGSVNRYVPVYGSAFSNTLDEVTCSTEYFTKFSNNDTWFWQPITGKGIMEGFKTDAYVHKRADSLEILCTVTPKNRQSEMVYDARIEVTSDKGLEVILFNRMNSNSSNLYSTGSIPMGDKVVDLSKYKGHVTVMVKSFGVKSEVNEKQSTPDNVIVVYDAIRY